MQLLSGTRFEGCTRNGWEWHYPATHTLDTVWWGCFEWFNRLVKRLGAWRKGNDSRQIDLKVKECQVLFCYTLRLLGNVILCWQKVLWYKMLMVRRLCQSKGDRSRKRMSCTHAPPSTVPTEVEIRLGRGCKACCILSLASRSRVPQRTSLRPTN